MLLPLLMLSVFAQENTSETKVGLTASLQSTQFDIMIPIWVGSHFSIAPAFGFLWAEDNGSDIYLGIAPRYIFSKSKVAPYIGAKLNALIASPKNGESATDVITGLAFGGEYFVDEHFSFGLESQLNITISSKKSARFGNPGKTNVNTGAAVFATIYF